MAGVSLVMAEGHLVLGAGSAGLGLAVALLDEGVRAPITVVDRRTGFGRDRTWCLFDVGPMPFRELATHRWSAWRIGDAVGRSPRHPYLRLDSADVYARALDRLERAPNVELRLGETVVALGDGWARTEDERLEAAWVYDALALGSPAVRDAAPELWQRFLGLEVRTARPVFDPATATLMDFAIPQDGGLAFVYVLPFARDRALVEHTTIGPEPVAAATRRAVLAALLDRLGAGDWVAEHTEQGQIPMTAADLGSGRGARTVALGIAGGAVRPSSGYAFARTQAQARAVASATAAGDPPPRAVGTPRIRALDAIFLRVLEAHPERFPGYFTRLAEKTPGDAFARFMGDASTPLDELRVIAATPKLPFAAAAVASATGG